MKYSILFLFLLLCVCANSQTAGPSVTTRSGKGALYFGVGFHRVFYTRIDISFKDTRTSNYDFTLHRVKSRDDNSFDFGQGIDAPQYSYRIGYYSGKKDIGIEFSFDHAKYIVVADQKVRISGQIKGNKINSDTTLHGAFLEYEHTDGANYYMLHLAKRRQLAVSANRKHCLSLVVKPGAGIVLPRSDTRVMGLHRDDSYHLAGYIIGMDAGLRYDLLKHVYVEATFKAAFANFKDVLLYGDGRAQQHWWSFQPILIAGFRLPV